MSLSIKLYLNLLCTIIIHGLLISSENFNHEIVEKKFIENAINHPGKSIYIGFVQSNQPNELIIDKISKYLHNYIKENQIHENRQREEKPPLTIYVGLLQSSIPNTRNIFIQAEEE